MKQCSLCGCESVGSLFSNFCVFCGGRMIEKPEKYYCSNPECTLHKDKLNVSDVCKFCGECGSPIVCIMEAAHE